MAPASAYVNDGNDAARPAIAAPAQQALAARNGVHRRLDGRHTMSTAQRAHLGASHHGDDVHRRRDGHFTMSSAERGLHGI